MSNELTFLLLICFAAVSIRGVWWAQRTGGWRLFAVVIVAELAFALFLHQLLGFPFPPTVVKKSPASELAAVIALYLCMLLGMISQHVYARLEKGRGRVNWRWEPLLAPVFVSPIVFIPLYGAFSSAVDLSSAPAPRFMIFLVAFQNGFFWKDFFEQRRSEVAR